MAIDTAQGKENAASGYVGPATHASLHTADPAGTGANEVAGGAPAYARLPVTWNPGGVDGLYVSDLLEFDVPPNTTLAFLGLWTALTAGTYLDKAAISATFVSQGKFRIVANFQES